MLAGNKLTSLPTELAECKNLELLRISANQIKEIPVWLFSLPKLSWIALAGNPYFTQNENDFIINQIDWNFLTIKDKLGEGASGTIYRAELLENEIRKVAVKVFKGEITSDGFPRDEMLTSIRAGNHPNLVKVLGKFSNHPENNQGLVLELIPENFVNLGNPPSFETCTRDTFEAELSFSLKAALRIMIGISQAVGHLHEQGIIHGDLYAHNILIDNANFQILFGDFGAASIHEIDSELTNELTRIEVRAFGCLMEDLLERVNANEKKTIVYQALTTLKLECLQSKVLARPNFMEILKRLSEIILIDL
jgi:serine/threonine protein kinase